MFKKLAGLAILVMVVSISCNSGFKSDEEEWQYLSSLSNPTPQQWHRRQELSKKFEHEADEERRRLDQLVKEFRQKATREAIEERKRQEIERNKPENVEARRQAAIKARQSEIDAIMSEAKAKEEVNGFRGALDEYQAVVRKYPDSPEAKEAAKAIKRMERKIEELKASMRR